MTATFSTPVAAVLLAVELLLFEWKPRSLVPVAVACATAALARPFLALGGSPLFAVPIQLESPDMACLLSATVVGLLAGCLSVVLSRSIYVAEDAFHHLPIHWMWWPLLGGLVVGIGGYFEPRALGVGYNVIEELMRGECTFRSLLPLLIVKAVIWSIALGSGTSGGVLAPLLMMGGILGGLEASFLPGGDARLWPLVSMAAVMGGAMRAPLTGVLFALELTYDVRLLLPLLIASAISYAFTVLVLKRSILTEKIARRGYRISCEYGVDPMERQSVAEVMTGDVVAIPATLPVDELLRQFFLNKGGRKHQAYPVVDPTGHVVGVITKSDLLEDWLNTWAAAEQGAAIVQHPIICFDLIGRSPVTAYPWESCRMAAERMAQLRVGRLPVISPDEPHELIGIITRSDLLKSHALRVDEEELRQRFFANNIPGMRRQKIEPTEHKA